MRGNIASAGATSAPNQGHCDDLPTTRTRSRKACCRGPLSASVYRGAERHAQQRGERIEQWLGAGDGEPRPLRLTKVHTLLVRDYDSARERYTRLALVIAGAARMARARTMVTVGVRTTRRCR